MRNNIFLNCPARCLGHSNTSTGADSHRTLYLFGWNGRGTTRRRSGHKAHNLYSTTAFGGSSVVLGGVGTVFKLDTSSTETVLYRFTDVPDGAVPYAGLVMEKADNLYDLVVMTDQDDLSGGMQNLKRSTVW
jgi:hypothetical protein